MLILSSLIVGKNKRFVKKKDLKVTERKKYEKLIIQRLKLK